MQNKIKIILTLFILNCSIEASEFVWDGKNSDISQKEYDKVIKQYVDKTYPIKVKKYKKWLEKNSIDKHGNIYKIVTSPYTGKKWLDRNLGASRVCQSYNDSSCYGDYFQWGRDSDGHEKKNSSITSSISYSSTPNHNKFIKSDSGNRHDWLKNQNDNLWQGKNGKNNPCPKGFRVPRIDELRAETTKQGVNNSQDAFNNFLKLPSAGRRYYDSGSMGNQGSWGGLWSSSVSGDKSWKLFFSSDYANEYNRVRANGFSVRCTKD